MKKEKSVRGKVVACAFVLLMLGVLFASVMPVATATTWTVDDSGGADFMSIQDAVDATSEGDTIIVKQGTYIENIVVSTDHLTIKSENGADSTIVQAANSNGHVFEITADYVNINGFTATGVTGTTRVGFHLIYGDYCDISYNTALNNHHGFCLYLSNNNQIKGNTVDNNNLGIVLSCSDNNNIESNTADNNNHGIYLSISNNNNIKGNTADHNSFGIYLHGTDNNIIYLNNFIDNTNNFYNLGSTNTWNSPEQITYTYQGNTHTNYLGNYWDDYIDIDSNNDGIWDNPYSIDSDNDYYPLVDPFENYDVSLQGKIAFASSRDGNQEVYVINADGSGHPTNLTNFPDADDGDPTWSPDGGQIAFSSNRSGNWKTYAMDADDGSNQVCLLEGVYDAWGPAWSPDGKKIAFACQLSSDDDFEIYTMDIQSKALTQVTDNSDTDSHPAWSPNSHKIVFTSTRDGNHELYVADLLANTQTRLTDDPAYDDYPEWSPDGSMIVFVSERDGNHNQEIYSMNIASKAITRLTYNEHIDKHAQYSPDGQKIIFVSDRDGGGNLDVYVMDADGTSIACLVDWEGDETHPTWSPSSAHDQPPTCAIELQKNENPIDNINVNEIFDIYVGDSTVDHGIKEVRFSSDESQDGNPTGEWTDWYDWDTSSGDWDAANKIKAWSFAKGGVKEVWAEIKDGDGEADRSRANIFAHPGYAIIVAGQDRGSLLPPKASQKCAIDHSANNAYRVLHNLGFDDDHIFYLNDESQQIDGQNVVDNYATYSYFNKAVNDVKDKIGDNPTPFILYLVGHGIREGDHDYFVFDEDNTDDGYLKVSKLQEMLDKFSLETPMLIVIGSCYSGCFITFDRGSISAQNRIIITACHDDEERISALGLGGWYHSSDRFWGNLNKGLNVKDAFIPNAWWPGEWKHLWLDDNGDNIGHPPDNLGNDGALASATLIGMPGTDDLELMSWYSVWIHSAGELRIYDLQNRVTGLVNGEVKEEIPDSIYDEQNKIVAIFSPSDTYRYDIAGTDEGTYGLDIASIEGGEAATFTATDIPTTTGATHEYTIDWAALSQGGEGVTVQVDSDGDGTFEYIFTADNELTQEEFLSGTDGEPIPEFTTIVIPVAIVLGLVFLISRRKRKEE